MPGVLALLYLGALDLGDLVALTTQIILQRARPLPVT